MKLIRNSGQERVIDALREWISPGSAVDMMTSGFSIHAFGESRDVLAKVEKCRVILGASSAGPLALSGGESDRVFRSRLQGRWLAKQAADWMARSAEVRFAPSEPPQSLVLASSGTKRRSLSGTDLQSMRSCSESRIGVTLSRNSWIAWVGFISRPLLADLAQAMAHCRLSVHRQTSRRSSTV